MAALSARNVAAFSLGADHEISRNRFVHEAASEPRVRVGVPFCELAVRIIKKTNLTTEGGRNALAPFVPLDSVSQVCLRSLFAN